MIIHCEGKKGLAWLGFRIGYNGGENHTFSHTDQGGTVGLASQPTGFNAYLTSIIQFKGNSNRTRNHKIILDMYIKNDSQPEQLGIMKGRDYLRIPSFSIRER